MKQMKHKKAARSMSINSLCLLFKLSCYLCGALRNEIVKEVGAVPISKEVSRCCDTSCRFSTDPTHRFFTQH